MERLQAGGGALPAPGRGLGVGASGLPLCPGWTEQTPQGAGSLLQGRGPFGVSGPAGPLRGGPLSWGSGVQ